MPDDTLRCLYCGGDPWEPDHESRCDGRQGGREDRGAVDPPVITTITITAPRETSIQAFYNAVDAGIIETRRAEAWDALRVIGIATANEVFAYLSRQYHLDPLTTNNTPARLHELRDLGLIREVGERPCRITGQTCITYTVVPSDQYAGVAVVNRCEQCGQIISRDLPVIANMDKAL